MAEKIAVNLATSILGKLLSLAAEEVIQAWNLKENLDDLRKKMEMVHALLCDADKRNIQMNTLQVWLEELEGVALEAEFLMDELAYQVSRRKAKNHSRVRKLISVPKNSLYYAHKIKNVDSSLDKVSKLAKDLGLNPASDINSTAQPALEIRHTSPFLGNSKIIGRDGDVSKVVQMLCQNNEEDLPVIVIVGTGGLGKTTLARQVYNHPEVINLFQEKAWITVSDDFDVKRLLNEMIESLFKETPQFKNMEAIVGKLGEKLKGKKFLLVLDDVWNDDSKKWDDMLRHLLGIGGSRGSKVLVTTRNNKKVVEAMQTTLCHQLVGLSKDDSWALFTQRAFADSGVFETKQFETIGRRMMEKCGGHPLAIHALGGLLHSKKSKEEWLSIENNKTWTSDIAVSCLKITYDHLSSLSLKQCFSYCSVFPKDFDFEKDKLIQIWMALGLLLPPRGNNYVMENVGDEYFHTLSWYSLLQDVYVDYQGNISCKMHDLVHDLALYVSTKYSTTIKVSDIVIDVSEAIYVNLEAVEGVRPTILKGNVGRVKALHVHNVVLGNLLSKFEHLTVLVLSSSKGNKELPSSISKLKYLRYLDVSELDYVSKLPDFITTLYNLQTLRVWNLKELPKHFGNLINMRHIHFHSWQFIELCLFVGIERMTYLQTLPYFAVSQNKGCHLKELGSLDKLGGKLHILGLCNVSNMEDARKAGLCKKTNIRNLILNWRRRCKDKEYNDEDVMEGLKPHPNLKELEIVDFMGKMFASWMMVVSQSRECLHNLVNIKFQNCNNCVQLPPLGHLTKLEEVVIDGMSNVESIGIEFYSFPESVGAGSSTQTGQARGVADTKIFPSLRKLVIKNMQKLVKICWEAGSSLTAEVFPCLEYLTIEGCSNLDAIPSHFQKVKELKVGDIKSIGALGELNSLTSLRLKNIRGGEEQIMDVDKLCGSNSKSSLRLLSVEGCNVFTCLRLGSSCVGLEILLVSGCPNITSIIISDVQLKSLKYLEIYECDALEKLPSELLQCCTSLEHLRIMQNHALVFLQELCGLNPRNLISMDIGEQPNHFPTDLISVTNNYCFSSLEDLTLRGLWDAKSGECLSQMSFPFVRHLKLDKFEGVEVLQHCLGKLSSLESLSILSSALKKLPRDLLKCCASLKKLYIFDCRAMVSLPDLWSPTLKSLNTIWIGPLCEELDHFPAMNIDAAVSDNSFSSLEEITLVGWPKIKSLSEEWLQQLSFPALRQLNLEEFDGLEVLPDWLGNLSSLQSLHILSCNKLVRFPEIQVMQRLRNLQLLRIYKCPLLKERCASGAEWPKIAHVPYIHIL